MKIQACLFLFLPFTIAFSQNISYSLESLYNDYNRTCDNNTDSAQIFITKAHTIAAFLKNDDWLAKTNFGLGYCAYLKRDNSLALSYTQKALKYAGKAQNKDVLSRSYTQMGQIYSLQNNYVKALKEFHKSLKISQKSDDLSDNTVSTLTYLADVFINQKDSVQALKYYYKAKYLGERKSSKKLDRTYSNLGVLYMGSQKDSALFYFKKALKLYQKNNNWYGEINSRLNLATTILNFKSKKDYTEALTQLKKAHNLAVQLKNTDMLFFSYYFLGVYNETADQNIKQAQLYYQKSLELVQKGYKSEYTIQLYKSLSRVAKKQGDFEIAYNYQLKFQALQDSVFSIEKNKQFHEIQTKFEVEQKNNRIQLLDKENEIQSKQKRWIFICASILILFLIIIAYVFKKEARSQKIIRKKDLLIFEKEKETIDQKQKLNEIKFLIEGQNKERLRISKELHDGVGSSVAVIKMNIALLNQNEINNNRLDLHVEQLNSVSKEIRIISHALSTGTNSEKSLLELIKDLTEIYQLNRKFEMNLTLFPEDCLNNLNEFQKINLYRVFQEAFANISKHSKAGKVEISGTLHEKQLTIIIEDNGIGFEFENSQGIGLKNMKERVEELNGILHIDSNKNHGTTITFQIPTKQNNEN